MTELAIDRTLLETFEAGLDPRHPERSGIPATIIGYGEISTIFEIDADSLRGHALKRMPIFISLDEVTRYEALYAEYNRLLADDIGISVPPCTSVRVVPPRGNMVVYAVQEKLPAGAIGDRVIRRLDDGSIVMLVLMILREMKKVWDFNASDGGVTIGFDGQISNWALKDYDGVSPPVIDGRTALCYIDTSTPLMRVRGEEQLDAELFLRSAPSFLIWLIRWLFLDDVMTRYYKFHLVAVDLIANFYKEQRPDLIETLVDAANGFFRDEAPDLAVAPLTTKEVRAYYREDAMIWRLYLGLRKLDRFLQRVILRRHYQYILPGKIQR